MAEFHQTNNDTVSGTIGGTLLTVLTQLDSSDLFRTLILASVGAIASFVVSLFCKWCLGKMKAKPNKNV